MKLTFVAIVLGFAFLAIANGEPDLDKVESSEEEISQELANDDDNPKEIDTEETSDTSADNSENTEQLDLSESGDDVESDLLAKKDAHPWFGRRRRRSRRRRSRRRRSRRRRSRRRRSRRRRSRRRRNLWGRRRRRWFGGRRRRFFTRRYWNRKFFPSCRTSRFRSGATPATRPGPHSRCILSNNLYEQARCWAPKVYLAIGEAYKPSTLEFFLNNVKMIRKSGHRLYTVNNNPRVNNMVAGNSNYFLKSKHRISTPSSTVPFFGGQNPSVVPIYTLWRQFRQGKNQVRDFVYWTFYPYNRGKNVCIGAAGSGRCFGGCTVMGNHVADWEHVTVRLVNNRPSKMYIGAHNFGGIYTWNGHTFAKGNDKVKFSITGHPIVYSAKGSHGLWTRRGRITYKKLKNGEILQELVSSGTAWDTWRNVKLIRYIKGKHYTGNFKWMNFKGRWGDPKRGCALLEKISGECRLNDGPEGPAIKSVMKNTNLS